jgi:hypothetical protein
VGDRAPRSARGRWDRQRPPPEGPSLTGGRSQAARMRALIWSYGPGRAK